MHRTRFGPGPTPDVFAITGSTRAATGATASATCSDSWRRRERPARPRRSDTASRRVAAAIATTLRRASPASPVDVSQRADAPPPRPRRSQPSGHPPRHRPRPARGAGSDRELRSHGAGRARRGSVGDPRPRPAPGGRDLRARGDWLYPVASAGRTSTRSWSFPRLRVIGAALASAGEPLAETSDDVRSVIGGRPRPRPHPRSNGPWGALVIDAGLGADPSGLRPRPARSGRRHVGAIVGAARQSDDVRHQLHRADALRRVAGDIGSRLDLDRILSGLVDHAMVLFEADRGAVFLRSPSGEAIAGVSRGLSQAYLQSVRGFPVRSLPSLAIAARRPLFAGGYSEDPRGEDVRAAVARRATTPSAPRRCSMDPTSSASSTSTTTRRTPGPTTSSTRWPPRDPGAGGDQERPELREDGGWPSWARSSSASASVSLTSDREIGLAIATELRTIIDYHNVRVYRLIGDDLIPVAMQGNIGEYHDETPEQLRSGSARASPAGSPSTGSPRTPDAAKDPAPTRSPAPRTTSTSRCCSRRCCSRTRSSACPRPVEARPSPVQRRRPAAARHLRQLRRPGVLERRRDREAPAQSDALERQLENQRRLLQVTESILTTLDPTGSSTRSPTTSPISSATTTSRSRSSTVLRPADAAHRRGIHAAQYMEPWAPGEEGLATWVVSRNEPALVVDDGTTRGSTTSGPTRWTAA